ncbi:MAG: hypothetical protein MZU95_01675, partial [Desulfomicrobium escambiense]|nr:hypothetical protein [Desulfomicrobium escambiense]
MTLQSGSGQHAYAANGGLTRDGGRSPASSSPRPSNGSIRRRSSCNPTLKTDGTGALQHDHDHRLAQGRFRSGAEESRRCLCVNLSNMQLNEVD